MFLGGLKPELEDDQIRKHFEQYGTILEFEMPLDKTKNQRKGFGFITFEREETMKDLIKKGKEMIGEHEIDLKKATPKSGTLHMSEVLQLFLKDNPFLQFIKITLHAMNCIVFTGNWPKI